MKEYEKMTVKELVDELTGLGVTFNKKSRKAELLELLLAETKGKVTASIEDKQEAKAKPASKEKPAAKASTDDKSSEAPKSTKKSPKAEETPAYSGYAIIRTGGKQYQVSAGSLVRVEKLAVNESQNIF